ncbi:MAG: hypothetical protein BEN18_00850 [Epulopiscium sp. Nuni2H_MBin001]|nr:MAG: hypothetical protein BEN18_00850 [Epulopiscium sp. Nuni2H_MBin001]
MKYLRFLYENKTYLGILEKDIIYNINTLPGYNNLSTLVDLIKMLEDKPTDTLSQLLVDAHDIQTFKLDDVKLLAPIERPIHDIICIGLNYKAHYEECSGSMPLQEPTSPVYFSKRSSKILGPYEDIPFTGEYDTALDYEVEFAVIIGKTGRDILPSKVKEHIFGYSVFNDVSARTLQKKHQQWYRGKSLDGTSIMGPWIVGCEDLAYPPIVDLESKVNNERRQFNSTSNFIYTIEDIIVDFSHGCTLEAGDIIITGTPAGVGMGFSPPKYLKVGDTITCSIEQIGTISNKIITSPKK